MRRLIVNADDFGLTQGVNRAIMEAHSQGIVTSATLMANGRAFDDAIQRAKSATRLSLGCHVVLVDGSPVFQRKPTTTTLSNEQFDDGRFYDSLNGFALRLPAPNRTGEENEGHTARRLRLRHPRRQSARAGGGDGVDRAVGKQLRRILTNQS